MLEINSINEIVVIIDVFSVRFPTPKFFWIYVEIMTDELAMNNMIARYPIISAMI